VLVVAWLTVCGVDASWCFGVPFAWVFRSLENIEEVIKYDLLLMLNVSRS
jgi:hypothetical protein